MPALKKIRSTLDILEDIQSFLQIQGHQPFYKSSLRSLRLKSSTINTVVEIIRFCQQELPELEIFEVNNSIILRIKSDSDS